MQTIEKLFCVGISITGHRVDFKEYKFSRIDYDKSEGRLLISGSGSAWKADIFDPVAILFKFTGDEKINYKGGYLSLARSHIEQAIVQRIYAISKYGDFPIPHQLQRLINWELQLFDDPNCIKNYHDWLVDNQLYDAARDLLLSHA